MASLVTRLGRSTERVGRVAFGCEQLGGHAWGDTHAKEICSAIEEAIAGGITLFDTADCYGLGESERRLGAAIARLRPQVCIATKFGVRFADGGGVFHDSSADWAVRAVEGSLSRLQVDVIDLFQVHYWDRVTPLRELFDALERLRECGKIRWFGITNHVPEPTLIAAYPGLVSVSLEYSLAERTNERLAQAVSADGLTFIGYGALGQGILSGKYDADSRFGADDRRAHPRYGKFHGAALARNLALVEVLRTQARQLEATPAQLAIAWALERLPECVVLVGIKRRQQVRDALAARDLKLTAAAREALESASAAIMDVGNSHD